jgi:oxidoreductase
MRAAVTGATGFIGRRLVSRLTGLGHTVVALSRGNVPLPGEWDKQLVEFRRVDINDEPTVATALHGCDAVFHLASSPSNDWAESYKVNVEGTRSVYSGAHRAGIRKFVHFSSIAVYCLRGKRSGWKVTEDCAKHPNDRSMGPYYHTKSIAEDFVLGHRRPPPFKVTVVRPGIVIGSDSPPHFQELGYRLPGQGLATVSSQNRQLALVDVNDLVSGIIMCLDRQTGSPEIYNFVTSEPITISEYLNWSRLNKHYPRFTVRLPYALPWVAALFYELGSRMKIMKRGRISRAQIAWKQADVRFSSERAHKHLGWRGGSPLRDTVDRTNSRNLAT